MDIRSLKLLVSVAFTGGLLISGCKFLTGSLPGSVNLNGCSEAVHEGDPESGLTPCGAHDKLAGHQNDQDDDNLDGGDKNDRDSNNTPPPPNDPNFVLRNEAAMAVVSQRCAQCHAGRNDLPEGQDMYSDEVWKNSGMIIAGDAMNSPVIAKLRNPAGGPLTNNVPGFTRSMPAEGNPLSVAEINTLIDWIELMERPDVVVFNIAPGTGTNDYNTAESAVEVSVGQTLRIRNNDSRDHRVHTNNNRPFPHGGNIPAGQARDHLVQNPADSVGGRNNSDDSIYDHDSGTGSWFHLRAFASE